MNIMKMFLLTPLAILVLLTSACAEPPYESVPSTDVAPSSETQINSEPSDTTSSTDPETLCVLEEQKYFEQLMALYDKWTIAYKASVGQPRTKLQESVLELQTIRYAARELDEPPCAIKLDTALMAHMNSTIEAYNLFIDGAAESDVHTAMSEAQRALITFDREVVSLTEKIR